MLDVLPILIIGAVSAFLVYHDDYDDGLVGRAALGLAILMAVIIGIGSIRGIYKYEFSSELYLFLSAVAAFATRHAWRFLQYHRNKKYSWDCVDRRDKR